MLLGRFLKSTSGGAAPFLALSLVPLMGFTGAAVDYSRGNAVKVAMQAALDSTGLILSKDAQNLSTGALASRIDSVFKAQFNRPEAHNVSVSYVFNAPQQGNFSLKLTGSHRADALCHPDRHFRTHGFGDCRDHLGHQTAQPRPRTRQYRLDGIKRQNDGAEGGCSQPAEHSAGSRQEARRRESFDHPLRYRRECRHRSQG